MLRVNAEVLYMYIAGVYASLHLCMVLYYTILCYNEKTVMYIKNAALAFPVRVVSCSLV